MQKITIIGNIGNDAVIKDFGDNQVINFTVAVNKKVKGENTTIWYDVSKWNNASLLPYLNKGTKVYVEGEPNNRAYINQQGQPVSVNGINALYIELLSRSEDYSQNPNPIPENKNTSNRSHPVTPQEAFEPDPDSKNEEDDDLPF